MDRDQLDAEGSKLWDVIIKRVKALSGVGLVLHIIQLISVGFTAWGGGMAGEFPLIDSDGMISIKTVMISAGAIFTILSGVGLYALDENVGRLVGQAKTYLECARELQSEKEELSRLDLQRVAVFQMIKLIDEAAKAFDVARLEGAKADLNQEIDLILNVARGLFVSGFGFSPIEKWTFSVFEKNDGVDGETMERIAAQWSDPLGAQKPSRAFKRGQGYTGAAWSEGKELIISNGNLPDLGGKYFVEQGKQPYPDDKLYVSVMVVLIKSGPEDIWGALTATSDVPGRFSNDPDRSAFHNMETVRLLAREISTRIRLHSFKFGLS